MPTDELDRLARELFTTFARFENALKASGFHCGDGDANPDWTAFARSVDGIFDEPADGKLGAALDYVLTHPPKKQVVKQGALVWQTVEPGTNLLSDRVLIYVRRVRNNLFHGGKFNGHWFEPQRSEELLRSSLVILSACLDASEPVREAYYH
jgi:hypothetical protein